jgi:hypothetical protein
MASKMSVDDLKLYGKVKGFASTLDNPNSVTYNVTGTASPNLIDSTPGIANNYVYAGASITPAQGSSVATSLQVQAGIQNYNTINNVPLEKSSWSVNTSGNYNNLGTVGSYINAYNFQQELRPFSVVNGNNVRVYYDYLVIRLGDILGIYDSIGLVRKFSGILRLYVNTGIVSAQISAGTGGATFSRLTFNPTYSTFTNTCPIMINNLSAIANYGAAATDITAGFFIAKAPNYQFTTAGGCGINFATLNVAQSFLPSTRYYYSLAIVACKLDRTANNNSEIIRYNNHIVYF